LWLHFNGETAGGYFDEFIKNHFSPVKFEDTFFMESTMRRILSLTAKKDLHSEILSSNLIVNLLTQLIILNNDNSLSLSIMPDYIKTSLKTLENHFLEPFSLDDLSSSIGISKYHLSREFKKYMGTTLNEYVITLRLNYAKELLRYTQNSIAEIAYTCGFNQVSHFINLFKSREAITPLQYRKEWTGNQVSPSQ
jgi:AraC-like DNA-binding protein